MLAWLFPQTGLPVGFYLRKKETGHAGGRAVLCWARIWPCWARDVAVLGALGWVGVGFGCAWRWGSALVGALGWVGRGFGCLCMVYIVHVFFMSSWCLCVYPHVYLRCVIWFNWFTCTVWGLCWYHLFSHQSISEENSFQLGLMNRWKTLDKENLIHKAWQLSWLWYYWWKKSCNTWDVQIVGQTTVGL